MAVQLNKGRAFESLNLTSLMDVVFLLLIFFLVATRFAEEDKELDVVLPNASEARPQIQQAVAIVINIDRNGNMFMRNQQLSPTEVDRALQQAKANNPTQQTVNIRADKRVEFDSVVQVLNLCRKNQIESYSIDTQQQ
jgi:biopolymer transport protein ExbD